MKKHLIATALLAASMTAAASAQTDAKLMGRMRNADEIMRSLAATPDKGVPLDIAAKAQCILIVPAFKKAAFVFGAQYGQGVATCRTGHGWSAPVFVQLEGASFGFQIGGQSSDIVLVGLNRNSMTDLLKDKVKLGGDIAVAAGPVGRNSQAATTELANAEFLTYSRSRGLFAGIDLTGDVVHQNTKDTEAFYGHDANPQHILEGGIPVPPAAKRFVSDVSRYFHEGRNQ